MESTTTLSLKRKDDFTTVDNATKRARTTDDDQAVPPTDVHDASSLQATDDIPDSQLHEAHEVGALPEGDDSREESGSTGVDIPAGGDNDVGDEDNVGNNTFVGDDKDTGSESDSDDDSDSSDEDDADWGPIGALYVYWEHPEYEERLVDKYHMQVKPKPVHEIMNSLLNRRLVDSGGVDNKNIWHISCIYDFTEIRSWNNKISIALSEHLWAQQWFEDIPELQWGSHILFPYSPRVRVTPLRRLRRGQYLGPSRLSNCIYTAPSDEFPPTADAEDREVPSSGLKNTGDDVVASISPPVFPDLVPVDGADIIPPSVLALIMSIPFGLSEQADHHVLGTTPGSSTQNVVNIERIQTDSQGTSDHHYDDPYVRGSVWQDSELMLWDMMPEVSMPL